MQFRGIGIPVWRAPSTSAVKADADEAMGMLLASKCSAMDAYWVSRSITTPRNSADALLEPVTP